MQTPNDRDDNDLLTEDEVAAWTGFSKPSLQSWRSRRNNGPAFIKLCGRVRYRCGDVRAWIESCRVVPASTRPTI